jgi:hypothetical protein
VLKGTLCALGGLNLELKYDYDFVAARVGWLGVAAFSLTYEGLLAEILIGCSIFRDLSDLM